MVTTPSRMRQLYATADTWTLNDPTLLEGEVGLESDTRKFKVGPGVWSTLQYWGNELDAPIDGVLYGVKNGTWSPGVDWVEPPQADCNSISKGRAQFLRLGATATNAWEGASEHDVILDLSHPDTSNRVQIGFSHSADGAASTVIHSRVLRGTWSGWTTSAAFSQQAFAGDLNGLAAGSATYSFEVHVTAANANGWSGIQPDAVVKTINIDADNAQQIGWQGGSTPSNTGVWLRKKSGGVWSAWQRSPVSESDVFDLDRVRWRSPYVFGTNYLWNDMVKDGEWTMVANKDTSDRAAPQETGDPQWTLPDLPLWSYASNASVVESGAQFEVTAPINLIGYQVWAPTVSENTNYVIRTFAYPTDRPEDIIYEEQAEPVLIEDDWTTIGIRQSLITAGTTVGLRLNVLNSGENTIVGPFDWTRDSNSNSVPPVTGEWNTSNDDSELRINFTDNDGQDRTGDLTGIIPGSSFSIVNKADATQSVIYTATTSEIVNGASYEWGVEFDDTGVNGAPPVGAVCVLTVTVPLPSSTDYVINVGGHSAQPGITGYLAFDGVEQIGNADNAFGVRILYDTYEVSPDWDVVALSGGGGGGGGGDGGDGVTEFINLIDTPASYIGNAGYFPVVNQTEDGLEFVDSAGGGDYVSKTDANQQTIVSDFEIRSTSPALQLHSDGNSSAVIQFRHSGAINSGLFATLATLNSDNRVELTTYGSADRTYAFHKDGQSLIDNSVLRKVDADALYGGGGGPPFPDDILVNDLTVGRGNANSLSGVAVGYQALLNAVDGEAINNVAIGYWALNQLTTGDGNVAVGRDAGRSITTSLYNVAIGQDAMEFTTTANNAVAIGYRALQNNDTGSGNIAIGREALQATATGVYNVAIGYQALAGNIDGDDNIAIGNDALNITTSSDSVAIGARALALSATGINTAIGYEALRNVTSGGNTAIGDSAGTKLTTGGNNTIMGQDALDAMVSGGSNVSIGRLSMSGATTGANNVAVGHAAMRYGLSMGGNTAIGTSALINADGGTNNTAVGYGAQGDTTTGSYNVGIGWDAEMIDPTGSDQITIRANSVSWWAGAGDPTDALAASPGSMFLSKDGGAGATLFVKETGTDTAGWTAVGGGGATTGDTFPADPAEGDLHYMTAATPGLFVWYVDPTSSQWVQTNGGGGGDDGGGGGQEFTDWADTSLGAGTVEFSLPPNVYEIKLSFVGVSLSGTNTILMQLSTGGVYVTTGYVSNTVRHNASGMAEIASTTGFQYQVSNATYENWGNTNFTKSPNSNAWVVDGQIANGSLIYQTAGGLVLAGEMDGIRIAASGTNVFDKGSMFIRYKTS